MVECAGLENRWARKGPVSSNLTSSASKDAGSCTTDNVPAGDDRRRCGMAIHVALLRAVNVGGRGKVAMADLRACMLALGFTAVRTVLQSGNLLVGTDGVGGPALERRLEVAFRKHLDLRTDVVVRSAAEWAQVVAGNPFVNEARRDAGHLVAMMAKRLVSAKAIDALRSAVAATGGSETVGNSGGQVYIYFRDGIGRSRVTTPLVERALGSPVTGRNWNTVLKLAELLSMTPS